ncbi:MAG TPA: LPXTG cell wall anchor domain-containing protein [Jatrophihabitans sp.]|nr:LPXTG cell wall anchor domain-containing protein [Jatrophihabitans sp.]
MTGTARARAARLGGCAAAVLACALAAGPAAGAAAASPTRSAPAATAAARRPPDHVGIVIAGIGSFCVEWHPGITGDDVLNAVARVDYRSDGVIVQIDGRPASATADDTHFWSYWHDTGTRWEYSQVGEGGYTPAAGEVEGWSFDDGAAKPPPPGRRPQDLYTAVCGRASRTAHAAPGATPAAARATRGAADAATGDRGSATSTLLAIGIVAILAGGGGWAAARRRRAR